MTGEIVVISGKGGTGKTTFASSLFAALSDAVLADCDVDAPDLAILLDPVPIIQEPFLGAHKAWIDPTLCREGAACGGQKPCVTQCRFAAIGPDLEVKRNCEGCGVCAHVCPAGAVTMKESFTGHLMVGSTKYGPMVHGRLEPGEETSGKLVSAVRHRSRKEAVGSGMKFIITDGSPGIGCPVISSLSGAHHVVIVTEPSVSALRDMERLVDLVKSFRIPSTVIINKADISQIMYSQVLDFCRNQGIDVGMSLPYDERIVQAVTRKTIPFVAAPDLFRDNGFLPFIENLRRSVEDRVVVS